MSSRDIVNLTILSVILCGLLLAGSVLMKSPRADRDWKPQFSTVAAFEETAPGAYRLPQLRDYAFAPGGDSVAGWRAIDIDADALAEMWFFIEPFPENPLFAHSFLSFVFEGEDGQRKTISVSIEARMEAGEKYSPIAGALRPVDGRRSVRTEMPWPVLHRHIAGVGGCGGVEL